MAKSRHIDYENCPVEAALELIGGKWKPVLLVRLLEGTKRFNEFRKLHPGITQRMLTRQLRELEEDGLVSRKVYPEIPPKVEYSITDFGRTLEPLLQSLIKWGSTHALTKKVQDNKI